MSSIWIILGPLFVIIGAGLWGTETYFRVHLSTRFDEEVLVFFEHIICILFSLPFAFAGLSKLKKVSWRAWIFLILSGVLGSAIGTTFFTMSLNVLNPSVANVLLNFQPLISVLFAVILLHEKVGKKFFLWACLALFSGAVIASDGFRIENLKLSLGLLYIAITAVAWGFSTVAGRGAMLEIPLRHATLGRFIIGAMALAVSMAWKGKFNLTAMNLEAFADPIVIKNYLFLSVMAGVVPLYFYFKGLSKTSASVAGFCELTQTLSALLLTWGIMGHALTQTQLIAGIILLVSVYMANLSYVKAK